MNIINSNSQENSAAVLVARDYDGFVIDTPLFIEADLSYAGDGMGNITLGLYNSKTLEWGDWSSECNFAINSDSIGGKCFDHKWTGQSNNYFETPWIEFNPNTWHNFRIEVDPAQFTITYFIDGTEVSSHIPGDSELLKQTDLQIALVTWKDSSDGTLSGLFDNVQIGEIAQ